MPVDSAAFRRALGQFASGVTVVTTRDAAGQPLGLTVSAFCSLSLEPPLVLVCIDSRSESHRGFEASGAFAVSVLAEDQESVSRRFAEHDPRRFEGLPAQGPLWVPGALVQLDCRVVAAHEAGDHRIYVGHVESLAVRPGRPLLYHAGRYRQLPPEAAQEAP